MENVRPPGHPKVLQLERAAEAVPALAALAGIELRLALEPAETLKHWLAGLVPEYKPSPDG